MSFRTIDELDGALRRADYLPDRGLATALFLGLALEKPVLLEGEAGVGKTEAAKALATALDARLIRLQCYEGLDVSHAVYEWNYPRQLLHIRAAQEGSVSEEELFGPAFLIRRPLLEAIDSDEPVVRREFLASGTHVNSVGLNPAGREVDDATVAEAVLVVESRASTLAPPPAGSPDLAGIDPGRVHAELGELVSGTRPGRRTADEITLYKSVGVAVQDDALHVLQAQYGLVERPAAHLRGHQPAQVGERHHPFAFDGFQDVPVEAARGVRGEVRGGLRVLRERREVHDRLGRVGDPDHLPPHGGEDRRGVHAGLLHQPLDRDD